MLLLLKLLSQGGWRTGSSGALRGFGLIRWDMGSGVLLRIYNLDLITFLFDLLQFRLDLLLNQYL